MKKTGRLSLAIGAVAVSTLAIAAPAMAAGPSAKATPHTKLKTGQTVTVTYSGFAASTSTYALECSKKVVKVADAAGCDVNPKDVKIGKSNAKGGGTFKVVVKTGKIGNGTCATVSTNCYIAVAQNGKTPVFVNASIHFGK